MDQATIDKAKEALAALDKTHMSILLNPNCKFMAYHVARQNHRIAEDPACETAWTDGYTCEYNAEWFLSLTEGANEARTGLALHEPSHSAYMHFVRQGDRDHRLWNIAADEEINHGIVEAGIKIPDGGYCTPKYKGWTAEEVYDDLVKDQPPAQEPQTGDCKGQGGSGGDTFTPDMVEVGSLTPDKTTGDEKQLEEHVVMVNQQAIMDAQINGWSDQIPGGVADIIKKLSTPVIPWGRVFRRFFSVLTRGKLTYRRFNRRYLSREMFFPDRKHESMDVIFIGQDTSGSVTSDEHRADLTEAIAIMKQGKPKKIHYIQWGSRKVFEKTFKPGDSLEDIELHRGGGTNAEVPLEAIAEVKPNLAVIFTDGQFLKTNLKDPGCPVIWVVYDNPNFKAPFGEAIKYTRRNEK